MNYKEAMDYIEDIGKYGCVPGLSNMKELMKRLGNPQNSLNCIHIAGTNGKGSVLASLSSILRCQGYTVGQYTSPAVVTYRERFQINGRMISQLAYCKYLEQLKQIADIMVGEGFPHPTVFEIETALAFLYFADKNCELVLLECGMGGRLDATNVIASPLASVITSISLDHMAFLGDSLAAIAAEKAGIIKNGCYAITGVQKYEVLEVLRKRALDQKTRLYEVQPGKIKEVHYGLKKQSFTYGGDRKISIALSGNYQIENAALVVEVLKVLAKAGYPVKDENMRKGFLETVWPGRFMQIGKRPDFYIDGAHNEAAALYLSQSVAEHFQEASKQGKLIYIMGVFRDKNYRRILELMCPYPAHIITIATPGNPRALPAVALAEEALDVCKTLAKAGKMVGKAPMITSADSIEEAVEMAYLISDKESVILSFGSLSYLGALMDIVEHKDTMRSDSHGK